MHFKCNLDRTIYHLKRSQKYVFLIHISIMFQKKSLMMRIKKKKKWHRCRKHNGFFFGGGRGVEGRWRYFASRGNPMILVRLYFLWQLARTDYMRLY